jgi:hypothetical protein
MSEVTNNQKNDPNTKTNDNEEENGASVSNDDVTFDYPDIKYEFLDNTADVQIHAWGNSVEESFEQVSWRSRR